MDTRRPARSQPTEQTRATPSTAAVAARAAARTPTTNDNAENISAGRLVDILLAMRAWAIACYSVATAAECYGLVLIFIEVHDSRRVLREWLDANPNKNEAGSWGQMMLTNKVVLGLLGSTRRRVTAAVLVSLGIIAGAAGNFLSLPSA